MAGEQTGRSLRTKDHKEINRWVMERSAVPSTVPGTAHDGRLGVLRFDFPGFDGRELRHVTWEEFLGTFDQRQLTFLYQETLKSGKQSNFFRFDSPDREDA